MKAKRGLTDEEFAARAAETDRRAEALGIDVRLAVTWARGCMAFRHLTTGAEDDARQALLKLDPDQLRQVEDAAVALSLLASRLQSDENPAPRVPATPRATQAPTDALSDAKETR